MTMVSSLIRASGMLLLHWESGMLPVERVVLPLGDGLLESGLGVFLLVLPYACFCMYVAVCRYWKISYNGELRGKMVLRIVCT